MMESREELDPFASVGLRRRGYPFATAALLAIVLRASNDAAHWLDVLVSLGLIGSVVGAILLLPWERWPADYQVMPLLWFVGGVAVINANSPLEEGMTRPLLLLPILWAAIYHKRSHLYLVAVVSVTLGILGGQLSGRDTPWQVALLPIVIMVPIAFAIQTFAEQVRASQRISEEASLVDALTGLGNRRRLFIELPRALLVAQRVRKPLALMIIDLDGFKPYNDTHGHQAGDALLERVARAWTNELRRSDLLFRYGGDEFIALLPDCDEQGARDVASRFMESLPDLLSCSIGIAVSAEDETPSAMIERGDVAMYRAKQQGRGQFVVWDRSIDVANERSSEA